MDAPPADLWHRDPIAFQLAVEVAERQLTDVTAAAAVEITGASKASSQAALAELERIGLLEKVKHGHYRPPRRCVQCQARLTGRQLRYCSVKCANDTNNARYSEQLAAERAAEERQCAVCGTALEPSPRTRHQKYCSRRCQNAARIR